VTDALYEEDFIAWTKAQADALRAAGRAGGRSNAVEWERVAEEVEDLGKSEQTAVESYVVQILVHLFKLAWSQRPEPRGPWRAEVRTFRGNALRKLTPTIRLKVEADLEAMHREAAAIARDLMATDEPGAAAVENFRWSLPQILGEADDPLS
jgi:Domain of unknown function DUF29